MKNHKNLFPTFPKDLFIFAISMLLMAFSTSVTAQSTGASTQFKMNLRNAQQNLEAIGAYRNTSNSRLQAIEERYANIQGTPYLHEEWINGDIHLVSGYVHKKVKVKLDIFNDMILYQGKAGLIALHKDYIHKFILHATETQQIFEKLDISGKENTFYEVIYNGPTRLLKYYRKELIKANTDEAYGDRKYDEFVNRDVYFLEPTKGNFKKIKLNKSSILKSLPSDEKDLKSFLKNSSLDLRNEAAIVELLNFYDSN